MAIERRIIELAGPVGGKLHTARSRNDQVATDMALFTRAHAQAAGAGIRDLMAALIGRRRAPPRLAHARLHAPAARPAGLPQPPPARVRLDARARPRALRRRRGGDGQAAARRRRARGRELRHRPPAGRRATSASPASPRTRSTPSPTATSCSTTSPRRPPAARISRRLGAEIVLWSSSEFGFAEVSDAWASGSSIMPQKKNPDAAELLRAKAPRIAGHLVALHGVMHALPLTYNKDMQEDKEHLFDAVDTLELCLAAATGMIEGIALRPRADGRRPPPTSFPPPPTSPTCSCAAGCRSASATASSPALVKRAVDSGRTLSELRPRGARRALRPARRRVLPRARAARRWLESKDSEGGTSLRRVREQLERARALLG